MQREEPDNELTERYHDLAGYRRESRNAAKIYALKRAYHQKNILPPLLGRFPAGERLSMLEFGPGMGCMVDLSLATYPGAGYTLVDSCAGVIEEIRQKYPQVSGFVVKDACQLEDLEESYDVIVAVDVWEHLPPEVLVPYTRWCWNHLRPGGRFVIQVPNWGCPLTAATFYSDLTHTNAFNEKSIRQLFRLIGVDDDCLRIFNRLTPGLLGTIRDALLRIYCIYVRALYILFGAVRLKIFSPDLVAVVAKPEAPGGADARA